MLVVVVHSGHYYLNTTGLVFVVDSNDRDKICQATEELYRITKEEKLKNVPVLIFANKQDLPNALTIDGIKEKMNLSKLDEMKIKWHVPPIVATQNKGINEGFQWLTDALKPKTDLTKPITETITNSKIMTNDLLSTWNSVSLKTLLSKFI